MKLYYVPKWELDKITDQEVLLDALRLNVLYQVQRAGSGHLGGSLSSLTIMVPLFFGEMGPDDVFIASKGHDAPALYAVLTAKGVIPFDAIHTFRRPGGLPGHPTIDVPGVMFNTGSLGMGISKANGLAAADRMKRTTRKIHVLVGDGELQEGQNWEALQNIGKNVIVHIDGNRFQLSRPASLPQNDGNMIYYPTIKGAGISFMEGRNEYHAGALSDEEYIRARDELTARLKEKNVHPVWVNRESYPRPCRPNYLTGFYSSLLMSIGEDPRVVVMDADLSPDCGLSAFAETYPDRFIQCGIAEPFAGLWTFGVC